MHQDLPGNGDDSAIRTDPLDTHPRRTVAAATPPAMPDPDADTGNPRRWKIMWVLGAVAFMAQLDFFVVNVALDGIGKSFPGSNVAGLSWLLSAYAIVFAAVLVPAGRIADLYGRKKVLLIGIGFFTLASIMASLAPGLGVLIAARAIQAVGAAMIVPTSLRVARDYSSVPVFGVIPARSW